MVEHNPRDDALRESIYLIDLSHISWSTNCLFLKALLASQWLLSVATITFTPSDPSANFPVTSHTTDVRLRLTPPRIVSGLGIFVDS
jgi:hypothetical protein